MNNPNFIDESELEHLEPIDSQPVRPGAPLNVGTPPVQNAMNSYFQGSLPPSAQHSPSFVGTQYGTPGIPSSPLPPLMPAANPAYNIAATTAAKIVAAPIATMAASTAATVLQAGNPPGAVTGISIAKAVGKDSTGVLVQQLEISFTLPVSQAQSIGTRSFVRKSSDEYFFLGFYRWR